MKNLFTLLFALLLISGIYSQDAQIDILKNNDKHIVSFRFGYSIPVAQSQIGSPRTEIGKTYLEARNGAIISEKNSFGSRGAGLNFSLGYEYMITENISVGMDFSYLYTLGINDAFKLEKSSSLGTYDAKQDSYTSMFRASPMVGIYANKNLLVRPYAKFGLIIPLAGATYANLSIEDETGKAFNDLMPIIDPDLLEEISAIATGIPIPTSTQIEASTSGAFSIGFDARVGAQYKLMDHLNIFVELNMQMLTVKAGQSTITKFNSKTTNETIKAIAAANGIDVKDYTLDDISEYLRLTKYVTEINEESNVYNANKVGGDYDRSTAADQLGFRDNYNAFGFIVGVKYGF